MSARSAQRTRWRRWRMGRDIAGRTGSRRTDEWLSPQLVAVVAHVAHWRAASSSSFPTLRTSTRRSASRPAVSYTFRFHGLHRV